ncbi:membrane-associated protease RseP (regulator of RpoE activity) [Georgenia soli]|uniref:Membrane-associated protease RseP (Regulator of RpoE activity) n=1 Tax=Georgenia soli TaxID=638953 RepID=A0A2A9EI30_9MICO|nr:RIP metalloprotease [Georgenia soli]PFG38483.1 membrane-associated protease RseP (regulator of RpoE activity) [Georgenia soli]
MDFVVGVLIVVVGLLLSIALHEIGHLMPAKKFGVKTPQYMIGFGRTLWSRTVNGTEYGIKALPLGGYVRMVGMYPPARAGASRRRRDGRPSMVEEARAAALEEIRPGEEHRAFYRLTVPKKLVVMLGGPTMNLLISAVLLGVLAVGLGVGQYTTTVSNVQQCLPKNPDATACAPGDPAAPGAEAGLQPGDKIVAWAGTPVKTWEDVTGAIAAGGTGPADVQVLRDGRETTVSVTPVLRERPVVKDGAVAVDSKGNDLTEERPYVGIGPSFELVRQPVTEVPGMVWNVFTRTVEVVVSLPQRLVDVAQAAFGTQERDPGVVGLIGVGRFAGEIASLDGQGYGLAERSADMLSLLVSLNMALFVFNLIPLLPLDGGHIAGALWEGARRRVARWRDAPDPGPVDTARLLPATYVVVALMLGMSVLLAYADIVRPVSLTG